MRAPLKSISTSSPVEQRQVEVDPAPRRREEEEELRRRHRRRHRRWPSISLPQATGTFTVRGISGSGVCRKAIGRWACRASGCPVPAAERLTASATPRKRRSQNCAITAPLTAPRRPSRGGVQLRPHMRWASVRSSVHPAKSGSSCCFCCPLYIHEHAAHSLAGCHNEPAG